MNKYIPAEKLIAEIETWIDIAEKRINNNAPIEHPETIDEEKLKYLQKTRESKITWLDGQEEALKKVLSIITSLQQEQPTKGYDEKYLNEKITKAKKSWDGVDVDKYMDDVRGREQPEIDLEKEIDNYIADNFSEAHDGVLLSDASGTELMITDISLIARHFYELGLNARKEE